MLWLFYTNNKKVLLVAMVGHRALFLCSTDGSEVHPAQCVGDVLDSLLVISWPGSTAANVLPLKSWCHHIHTSSYIKGGHSSVRAVRTMSDHSHCFHSLLVRALPIMTRWQSVESFPQRRYTVVWDLHIWAHMNLHYIFKCYVNVYVYCHCVLCVF